MSRRPVQRFTLPERWNATFLRLETLDERLVPAFLDPANYAVGTSPSAIVTSDFNNDGRLDLAVGNSADGTVSVLLGNANGTFQPAISSTAGNAPSSLAVGDFNNDGKLDLAAGDNSGWWGSNTSDVTVLMGKGDGTFQAPSTIDLGFYNYYGVLDGAASVAVGDFNADGKLDLGVLSNYYWSYWGYYGGGSGYDGYATVLLGTGTGTFNQTGWSYLGYGYHSSAAVADFNTDGKLDIASASSYYSIDVGLGNGDGTFAYPTSFSSGYGSIIARDLNKDGQVDLAAANYGDTVNVLLGSGSGTFGSPLGYSAGSQPTSLSSADFNGDGTIDLVTANVDSATVSVMLGDGTGFFKPPVTAAAGTYPVGVAVGDFNGDGRMDAASVNSGSNNVSVLLNDGTWPALSSPSISVNDVTVTEGNTGTVNATFTVSLSAASSKTVTVDYATVDGSATTAGGDYQAASGTLSFAPGETTKTVTVRVNGDRLAESNEYFQLVLTDPANAFVADARGVGNITDDEPHVTIDYGPVYVTEGNTGTIAATFTVHLSNAYDQPVTVNYATQDGTATSDGGDYQAATSSITFAPGETTKTITVVVNGDRLAEFDWYDYTYSEYFYVHLTDSTDATIDYWSNTGLGVIEDDEPRIGIDYSASVTEGNTGTAAMTFTVRLSNAYDQPVTVDYATSDGSATTAGGDYQAASGTVTFAPGETTKTITVLVNGDRVGEYDEYLYVQLSNASSNAVLESSYGYGTILDNEPRISINSVSITEGNSGTKLMTFTVSLSVAYDQAVTVHYATQDGSAKAGEDYNATSGTLTFAAGQTTKTFTVAIKGDKKKEYDEYFYAVLSDASTNALIYNGYGYGTILNDEKGGGPRR